MKDIKLIGKARPALDEITKFYNVREYSELVAVVEMLLAEGKITPVKSVGVNGKDPSLHKKYHVVEEEIDTTLYLNELKTELPPNFSIDYYRNNIEKYIEQRDYVLALSHFFKFNKSSLDTPLSVNERSFQIWGEEKFLKVSPLATLVFKNLGLRQDQLNVYATPEPFFHTELNKDHRNILIVENKDTWYTMKKLINEGHESFFGLPFATIIYGEGKKILYGFEEFSDGFHTPEMNYYYFGDLDYEGAHIYLELKRRNRDSRQIILLHEAYLLMLNKAQGHMMPKMSVNQAGKKDFEQFLNEFDSSAKKNIKAIIDNGFYIPQEIINYKVLKETRG